jgi:esterase/lipase
MTMWLSSLYTIFSIVWYSLKGLFAKIIGTFFIGDTKVYKLTNGSKKAIIVFHGLSGSGDSGYIRYLSLKLKGLYDVYAPEYGSDKHLFATYNPTDIDPVYTRDVISLYRKLINEYDQVSFIAFSAGGGAVIQVLEKLNDEDIKNLNSMFFVSPAFKSKEGLQHLENVWFLIRWIMKFDYWSKHFSRIKKQTNLWNAVKFWFKCKTFEDVVHYLTKNKDYLVLNVNPIIELNSKLVLLHPDDDPIVQINQTLSFMGFNKYTRINQLEGGHVGFKALDRCVKFYQDNENVEVNEIWDPTKLIQDQ